MWQRHIAECDALARALHPDGRWLDLGTGGGLPGLVLAYRHPAVAWVLVDATTKKAEAVREFAAALGLANVTVIAGRAESLAHEPQHRGAYQGVVSRAVAQLPVLVELCRGFVPDGGLVVAMKGPAWEAEVARARGAMTQLGLELVHSRRLPLEDRDSWVVTMRANGAPPTGFPRRDGIPRQQPLA